MSDLALRQASGELKKCTACRQLKPREAFSLNGWPERKTECTPCTNIRNHRAYLKRKKAKQLKI